MATDTQKQAVLKASELGLHDAVLKIARSGEQHGERGWYRDVDGKRFFATFRASGETLADVYVQKKQWQMHSGDEAPVGHAKAQEKNVSNDPLYCSSNSGDVVRVFRQGPWVDKALALAKTLPELPKMPGVAAERDGSSFTPYNE